VKGAHDEANERRTGGDGRTPGRTQVCPAVYTGRERRAVTTRREAGAALLKREEAQAELERIDRAVQATDELLELLTPLLAANGNEPEAARGNSGAEAGHGTSAVELAEVRDRAQH
jgi:hypothetical protein